MRRVRRLGDVHFLQQLLAPVAVLAAVEGLLPQVVAPRDGAEGAFAVDEDVVFGAEVVPAVGEDGAEGPGAGDAGADEDVAEDEVPAVAVVEVDSGGAVAE